MWIPFTGQMRVSTLKKAHQPWKFCIPVPVMVKRPDSIFIEVAALLLVIAELTKGVTSIASAMKKPVMVEVTILSFIFNAPCA
jgi:hypothetical protein